MIHATGIMALGFILIISLERYNGIVKPFLNDDGSSSKKVFLMGFANVLLSILFVTPTIIIIKMTPTRGCEEQWAFKGQSLIYSWFSLIITFVFPIVVISYLYLSIVKTLQKSQNRTKSILSKSDQVRRKKENNRVTTIIASLLISFVLLVSPNRVYWVLSDHGVFKKVSSNTLKYIRFSQSIAYDIHACINPIIYSLVDKKFRQSFLHLFYKITCQRKAARDLRRKPSDSLDDNRNKTFNLAMSVVNRAFNSDSS